MKISNPKNLGRIKWPIANFFLLEIRGLCNYYEELEYLVRLFGSSNFLNPQSVSNYCLSMLTTIWRHIFCKSVERESKRKMKTRLKFVIYGF